MKRKAEFWLPTYPANVYLFKVKNKNTRKSREIRSKLTLETPKWRQRHCFLVLIVNFEYISHLCLLFVLLTVSRWMFAWNNWQPECILSELKKRESSRIFLMFINGEWSTNLRLNYLDDGLFYWITWLD